MKVAIRKTGKGGKRSWLIVDVIGFVDALPEDVVCVVDEHEDAGAVGILGVSVGESEVE